MRSRGLESAACHAGPETPPVDRAGSGKPALRHTFRWRGLDVVVGSSDAALISKVSRLLDLPVETAPPLADESPDIAVDSSTGSLGLHVDGERRPAGAWRDLVLLLAAVVCNRFLQRCPEPLLHAGGLDLSGEAVLFCGPSRCGKSALSFAAWRRGHQVIGDDRIVVDPGNLVVSASPRPLSLREPAESAALAEAARVDPAGGDHELGLVRGETRLALGRRLPGMVSLGLRLPVRDVLVLERGPATTLTPLDRSTALGAFVEQSVSATASPLRVLRLLEPLWRAGRVHRLAIATGGLDEAVTLLESLER